MTRSLVLFGLGPIERNTSAKMQHPSLETPFGTLLLLTREQVPIRVSRLAGRPFYIPYSVFNIESAHSSSEWMNCLVLILTKFSRAWRTLQMMNGSLPETQRQKVNFFLFLCVWGYLLAAPWWTALLYQQPIPQLRANPTR